MSGPEEPCVCDLTQLMRARLVCGLYSRRAVPPRYRRLAQAYCVSVAVAISICIYFTYSYWTFLTALYVVPSTCLYYLSFAVSLLTGDEYIYKIFHQNKLTDVTLDSRNIFSLLQKRTGQMVYYTIVYLIIFTALNFLFVLQDPSIRGFTLLIVITSAVIDIILTFSSTTKILIMALLDARMLVLKRRLQRYGFRKVGLARPQPYYQVYDEIWEGLDATDNPLKLLVFFDLISGCTKLICMFSYYLIDLLLKDLGVVRMMIHCLHSTAFVIQIFVYNFGFIVFLESAAVHNEDMAIFTVTQLIKTPTAEERQRMRQFLSGLERRGARYRILRALPIDARFMLRVLGFCTAQALVIINAIKNQNN